MYLEKINSPADLAGLSVTELELLAAEIRELVIETVSVNGGHLGASLGTVELILALHRVFKVPEDRLLFDVGHQAYAHKILTGRREFFKTLRRHGGCAGFPAAWESEFDVGASGHAGTAISTAVGLSAAFGRSGSPHRAVAVVGDGALNCGMSLEGMINASRDGKNLIVVLNDNEMSISHNVGALSLFLSRNMERGWARRVRREVKDWLKSIPGIGDEMAEYAHRTHRSLKTVFTPGMLFEALRFNYIGPVNGHNIEEVERHLRMAASIDDQPVLLHVLTRKGKGYPPAEAQPSKFHGLGKFDVATGQTQPKPAGAPPTYTDIFGETLCRLAKEDDRIVAVTAAMSSGTGTGHFKSRFPTRFTDVGICEQHAVTFAAGLASQGYRPFVAIYSTFSQRAYDQIIHDVCIQKLPVTLCLDRAGLVGEDGPTHHGAFDLSFLRHIPNIKILAPRDEPELQAALITSLNLGQPLVIRYPRGSAPGHPLPNAEPLISLPPLPLGEGELLREGTDAVVIAVGSMVVAAQNAAERLFTETGRSVAVFDARWIKPLPEKQLLDLATRFDRILFAEENALAGGFSSAVLELLVDNGALRGQRIKRIGLPDAFVEHGTQAQLRHRLGLDDEGVYLTLKALMEEK